MIADGPIERDELRCDIPAWQREAIAKDRAFVLSPEFARLFRLAHHEGLIPAILQAANLDLCDLTPQDQAHSQKR